MTVKAYPITISSYRPRPAATNMTAKWRKKVTIKLDEDLQNNKVNPFAKSNRDLAKKYASNGQRE